MNNWTWEQERKGNEMTKFLTLELGGLEISLRKTGKPGKDLILGCVHV